jgi:hypothetical protein
LPPCRRAAQRGCSDTTRIVADPSIQRQRSRGRVRARKLPLMDARLGHRGGRHRGLGPRGFPCAAAATTDPRLANLALQRRCRSTSSSTRHSEAASST